jgi:phosphate transport system substrate-binding protein
LLWWIIHEGQQFGQDLNYAPLPDAAVKAAELNLKSAMYGSNPLL